MCWSCFRTGGRPGGGDAGGELFWAGAGLGAGGVDAERGAGQQYAGDVGVVGAGRGGGGGVAAGGDGAGVGVCWWRWCRARGWGCCRSCGRCWWRIFWGGADLARCRGRRRWRRYWPVPQRHRLARRCWALAGRGWFLALVWGWRFWGWGLGRFWRCGPSGLVG